MVGTEITFPFEVRSSQSITEPSSEPVSQQLEKLLSLPIKEHNPIMISPMQELIIPQPSIQHSEPDAIMMSPMQESSFKEPNGRSKENMQTCTVEEVDSEIPMPVHVCSPVQNSSITVPTTPFEVSQPVISLNTVHEAVRKVSLTLQSMESWISQQFAIIKVSMNLQSA